MICKHCGSENKPNATMCVQCGRPLDVTDDPRHTVKVLGKKTDMTTIYAIFGFLCAGTAIFFFPPVFGGIGIWCGVMVKKQNIKLGMTIFMLSVVFLIIGMIAGMMDGIGI